MSGINTAHNKVQVTGKTDGAIPGDGFVGQIRGFTPRLVPSVTAGWTANTSVLDTLPAGVWLICAYAVSAAGAEANKVFAMVSSNNTNDSSGSITDGVIPNRSDGLAKGPLLTAFINTSTNYNLYAKAIVATSSTDVTVGGFAVRIA